MNPRIKADYEKVEVAPGASFAVNEYRSPRFESPWHFHPEVELTLIVEGRGRRFAGDSIEPFGPGDLVLIGPNVPHVWLSEAPRSRRRAAWSNALVIQFLEDFAGTAFWELPEWKGVRNVLIRARRGLHITGTTRQDVEKRMRAMRNLPPAERLLNLLGILALLAGSRALRPLATAGFVPQLDHHAESRINRSVAYVRDRLSGTITLPEAAAASGMSTSAFSRYFTRVMGKTFTQFVNEMRIGHVCRELLETDRTISEIAYAGGYDNLANFNRRFRELRGMSPREYRKAYASVANRTNQA